MGVLICAALAPHYTNNLLLLSFLFRFILTLLCAYLMHSSSRLSNFILANSIYHISKYQICRFSYCWESIMRIDSQQTNLNEYHFNILFSTIIILSIIFYFQQHRGFEYSMSKTATLSLVNYGRHFISQRCTQQFEYFTRSNQLISPHHFCFIIYKYHIQKELVRFCTQLINELTILFLDFLVFNFSIVISYSMAFIICLNAHLTFTNTRILFSDVSNQWNGQIPKADLASAFSILSLFRTKSKIMHCQQYLCCGDNYTVSLEGRNLLCLR